MKIIRPDNINWLRKSHWSYGAVILDYKSGGKRFSSQSATWTEQAKFGGTWKNNKLEDFENKLTTI